jgi:Predicted esterase
MAKVVSGSLQSRLIQRSVPYRVILPASYKHSKRHFPVLYLLHGLFGNCDNWTELTDILSDIENHDLIVVAPDSGNSWYTDSETNLKEKFESYLIVELVPEIESLFRVKQERESRAIAGISMGGYGAFKLALKQPNMFIFAASSSGALHAARMSREVCGDDWPELEESITRAFGKMGGETRAANDLDNLVSGISYKRRSDLPLFYFDCGDQDSFLNANRAFAERLNQKRIANVYQELPGEHGWPYWNERVGDILEAADKTFKIRIPDAKGIECL